MTCRVKGKQIVLNQSVYKMDIKIISITRLTYKCVDSVITCLMNLSCRINVHVNPFLNPNNLLKERDNKLTHFKQMCHIRVDLINKKLDVVTHLLPE